MIEGSGSGSTSLTSGSGSGRPKNMWILVDRGPKHWKEHKEAKRLPYLVNEKRKEKKARDGKI
jgi:hypothetical protein